MIGSRDRGALRRVARWADGWCPLRITAQELKDQVGRLRTECERVGRDFDRLEISVVTSISDDRSEVREGIAGYAEAGAKRLVVGWRTLDADHYEKELDRLASLYL